jgi:hypothetical protein
VIAAIFLFIADTRVVRELMANQKRLVWSVLKLQQQEGHKVVQYSMLKTNNCSLQIGR